MANPVAFPANSNPFRGGSFTPGTVPALNGAIAPASTGGSLQGSVTAGQPMLARNNRGSNIAVPYARVVLHPAAQTALAPAPDAFRSGSDSTSFRFRNHSDTNTTDNIFETDGLLTGRVAFVLGRRGTKYSSAVTGAAARAPVDALGNPTVPFREANQLAQFAVGGADVNTMQRMCSFEYLQRYFHHVLKTKVIELGQAAGADFTGFDVPSDYLVIKLKIRLSTMTNIDGEALLKELSKVKYNQPNPSIKGGKGIKLRNSGIFLADDGPFLRGKTLETSLAFVAATKKTLKDLPAAIGDIIAFDRLQQLIMSEGACDWVPDGVVHSKLSQGDKLLDDEVDSRDGQLYNVTVAGPAITSSWTEDKHMQVLPLDKVFVVIVADVWDDYETDATKPGSPVKAHEDGDYEHALLSKVNAGTGNTPRNAARKMLYAAATDTTAAITNMRVRLMTSSEMVGCSAVKRQGEQKYGALEEKDANAVKWPARGANAAASKTNYEKMERDRHVRLGLKLGGDGGVSEYIIGGWCIGTVLDAAAARSSADGVSLVGAVKRQRTAHASNIKVKVEWWSADKMYRSFMNVKGGLATRYNGSNKTGKVVTTAGAEGAVLAPATART